MVVGVGGGVYTVGGGNCASRLNLLSAGCSSSSSLMCVYARRQEVVITGDSGVTRGKRSQQVQTESRGQLICPAADDGHR